MIRLFLLPISLLLASCGQPEQASVQVLIGARLLDGTGQSVDPSVIVVEDGVIRSLGPQTHTPIPAGSKKVDLSGRVIRPKGQGSLAVGSPATFEVTDDTGKVLQTMEAGRWR